MFSIILELHLILQNHFLSFLKYFEVTVLDVRLFYHFAQCGALDKHNFFNMTRGDTLNAFPVVYPIFSTFLFIEVGGGSQGGEGEFLDR